MTLIVDYGVGNLFSLKSSLEFLGEQVKVSGDKNEIKNAERIILPGVGAFCDAMKKLDEKGLCDVIKQKAKSGTPILGICLGMQVMLKKSFEFGEFSGLGIFDGEVIPIKDVVKGDLKIPHIGWNALHFCGEKDEIFKYIDENDCVYFVHSFFATNCEKDTIATCEYDKELTAALKKGNTYALQFHPEKSGEVGLKILKAFCEMEGTNGNSSRN